MSTRRLFFALWPDEAMRGALGAAVEGALKAAGGGQPVPLANLHVTLAFLGSVPESSLARLLELAQDVARVGDADHVGAGEGVPGEGAPGDAAPGDAAPGDAASSVAIAMRLDRIEYWRKAEILCAAASEMPAGAEALSGALKSVLVAADFRPDLKPFRAHVTLARKVRRAPPDLAMPAVTWSFRDFALIESRALPEGSSYSVVESWVLGGTPLDGR